MIKQYRVTESVYEVLMQNINKINKKADKLGKRGIILEDLKREVGTYEFEGVLYEVIYYTFGMNAEKPIVEGWELIASLENYLGDNIVRYMVGVDEKKHTLKDYQKKVNCDHCQYNRKRLYTYILYREDRNEYIQVGKSCLEDFIEGDISYMKLFVNLDVESIIKKAESNELAKPKDQRFSSDTLVVPIDVFLAKTIEYIEKQGYKPTSQGTSSTGAIVWSSLTGTRKDMQAELQAKHQSKIDDIKNYMKRYVEEKNDYLRNLSILAEKEYVRHSVKNMLASMVYHYMKEQDKESKAEPTGKERFKKNFVTTELPQKDGQKFMGEVNTLIRGVEVILDSCIGFNGNYGYTNIYKLRLRNNRMLVTFSKKDKLFEEGKVYVVAGNVRGYRMFDGYDECQINSLRILEESHIDG